MQAGWGWVRWWRGGWLALCLLAGPAAPVAGGEGPQRFLWISAIVEAGWGDNFRRYYEYLALAAATGRTLVLPPFTVKTQDLSGFRNVDPNTVMRLPQERWMEEQRRRVDYSRLDRWAHVPFGEWVDLAELRRHFPAAIDHHEWHRITDGIVDTAVVQPHRKWYLPLPEFQHICRQRKSQATWLPDTDIPVRRFGTTITFRRAYCATKAATQSALADIKDIDEPGNPLEDIARWLTERFPDERTLGLDSNKYRRCVFRPALYSIPEDLSPSTLRGYIRLHPDVYRDADAFLEQHSITHYVCVHWRRGDITVDFASDFLPQTADWLIRQLRRKLRQWAQPLTAIVLITDSPYVLELAKFRTKAKEELGLDVFQRTGGDPVRAVVVDLALGCRADLFVATYSGSLYADFIAKEREASGKVAVELLQDNTPDEL